MTIDELHHKLSHAYYNTADTYYPLHELRADVESAYPIMKTFPNKVRLFIHIEVETRCGITPDMLSYYCSLITLAQICAESF